MHSAKSKSKEHMCSRDHVSQARQNLCGGVVLMMHHDNASAHSAVIVWEFLARNSITMPDYLPYSPGLVPCDFFLFP